MFERIDNFCEEFRYAFSAQHLVGPTDVEPIRDARLAAFITDFDNSSFQSIPTESTILLGRRGAGKSSVIEAFKAATSIAQSEINKINTGAVAALLESDGQLSKRYTAHIELNLTTERLDILRAVDTEEVRIPEDYTGAWRRRIWMLILTHAVRTNAIRHLPAPLAQLVRNFAHPKAEFVALEAQFQRAESLGEIENWDGEKHFARIARMFEQRRVNFLVLCDSLDRYEDYNRELYCIVAALMQVASEVGPLARVATFKIAIPLEIYDLLLEEASADKVLLGLRFIRWTQAELQRVAAFRYLCYLRLHHQSVFDVLRREWGGWSDQQICDHLIRRLFSNQISNEVGLAENAWRFILRHTQLLPRHMLLHLGFMMAQAEDRREYPPYISADSIRTAVFKSSIAVATHITKVYNRRYDGIAEFAEVLGNGMKAPIIRVSDLHAEVINKSKFRTKYHIEEVVKMFMNMGMLGVVDPATMNQRYVTATYNYSVEHDMSFSENTLLAMHPVFCTKYGIGRDEDYAIMPVGSE